jgi:hypothetical protein
VHYARLGLSVNSNMQGNENSNVEQMQGNQCPINLEDRNSISFHEAQEQNRIQAQHSFPKEFPGLNWPTSTQNKIMGVGLGLLLNENCKVKCVVLFNFLSCVLSTVSDFGYYSWRPLP